MITSNGPRKSRTAVVVTCLSMALMIFACSDEDNVKTSQPPPITYDIYVDVNTGDDSNDGSQSSPYKTISKALAEAEVHDTIKVAPGTYDASTGETFPIVIPDSVTLVGVVSNKALGSDSVKIEGDGDYDGSHRAAVVGGDGSVITGCYIFHTGTDPLWYNLITEDASCSVIENSFSNGYGCIKLIGSGDHEIINNEFSAAFFGVYIDVTGEPLIQRNKFEDCYLQSQFGDAVILDNTFEGNASRAVDIWTGAPLIEGDSLSGIYNLGCLRFHNSSTPTVRRNTFDITGGYRVQILDDAQPDLGTVSDSGYNVFGGLGGQSVNLQSAEIVEAIGNTWKGDPPNCGTEILVSGSGKVIFGTGASDTCQASP